MTIGRGTLARSVTTEDLKVAFISALERQKLVYGQIEEQGKKTAVDSAGKTIRPLWWADASDGVVVFSLNRLIPSDHVV